MVDQQRPSLSPTDPPESQSFDTVATPYAREDPAAAALLMAGRHLLNVLRSEDIEPSRIAYQAEALDRIWPTRWAYDAWSAWHACRIGLRRAGYDPQEIAVDRRTTWRTAGTHRGSQRTPATLGAVLGVLREVLDHAEGLPDGTVEEVRGAAEELRALTGTADLPDVEPAPEAPLEVLR